MKIAYREAQRKGFTNVYLDKVEPTAEVPETEGADIRDGDDDDA